MDVSRGAGRVEVETGSVCERTVKRKRTTPPKKQHGQHEFAVLHRGYGSWRLPAEKFLYLVPIFVTERRELARQARQ